MQVSKMPQKRVEATVVLSPEVIQSMHQHGFSYEIEALKDEYRAGECPVYLDLMPILTSTYLKGQLDSRRYFWTRFIMAQVIILGCLLTYLHIRGIL